jgi:hypothetical protein
MPTKAMILSSNSQNSDAVPPPRQEGRLTLTLTGYQAGKLLNADPNDDQFAYFCPGCLRPLSMCSCPIDER